MKCSCACARAASAEATFTGTTDPRAGAFLRWSWGTRRQVSSSAPAARSRASQVGDRVTFDSTVSCGKCDFCRQGQINLCDNRMVLGVSCGDYRRHGAFAEYVSVPARILYKLPDSLPFERAALIEAVSIAVHAVSRHVPKPDDAVLVVGSGMIGVLVIQVLREKGCRNIIAVDVDDEKLALAKRVGATRTVNAKDIDVPAAVRDLTGSPGRGRIVRSRWPRHHRDECHPQPPQGRNGRADRQSLSESRDTAAGGRVARDLGARLLRVERRNSRVHRPARPRRGRRRSAHQPEGVARRSADARSSGCTAATKA